MQPLRDIIRALKAKKSLGQNFLIDPNILSRIVGSAGILDERTIIEVGPGPGGLTREIVKQPCKELILIEQDERCLPYLSPLKEHFRGTLTLLNTDALTLPIHSLGEAPRKIISNLPYNISVPLLLTWLEHIDSFENLTLMFQKEVGDRITAASNTSAYGRLSIMAQWRAHIKKAFELPPGAFFPPPKVTSSVLIFTPRHSREEISWTSLENVTRAAFSQRRKMLRSSLKELVSQPMDLLEKAEINPELRAENLSVQEFCRLAHIYENETGKKS